MAITIHPRRSHFADLLKARDRMNPSQILLVFGLVAAGTVLAHEDRLLPIADDGAMSDVPSTFGPAKLQINFSSLSSDEPPVSSIILSLGAKRIYLPSCVTGLFLSQSIKDVKASGSWHHDESHLPYYINVTFLDPGHDSSSWKTPGYSLLFNLRTGKLIKMEVHIARDNGESIQYVPVDVAARCPSDVLTEIMDNAVKK